jgi:hypothetical protein
LPLPMTKKIFITLIFFLTGFVLPAAKISKAFEALKIYDYFKAKALFYSALKKEPVLASYGLAVIYYRTDNPFHNYDSAYKYIQASYSLLKEHPENAKKLKRTAVSEIQIFHLRDSVHLKAWQYYLRNGKKTGIPDLEQFMQNQPFSMYFIDAWYKRDSIVYNQARQQQRSSVMKEFIRSFPESFFVPQASRYLDYYRFTEFSSAGSIPQIEKFIDSFPLSAYRIQAEDKLFELATAQKNTTLMYAYIKRFPQNPHVEPTWKSLYSMEVGNYSSSALNTFLEKYSDFPYRQTIEKELSLANTLLLPVTVKGQSGFIDTSGTFVIPAIYDGLEEFSDGLALAERDGKFGYINKVGETVVPFVYDDGEAFKNGRAIVKTGKDFFLIDRSGNSITGSYDQISDFSEGLAVVKLDGLYGAIDKNGKTEIPLEFSRLGDFSEGYSYAQKNSTSGYVDKKGYPVLPFLYEWAESFKFSLARVKYNSKFGLINTRGEFVLQPVYDRIEEQERGVYVVYKNNAYGFADSTGCLLSEVIYHNPANEKPGALTNGKWLRLITEDDQNLMNKNGRKLAETEEYEEMYLPQYGLIRVSLNEKYGFVNERNKLLIKNTYDDADDFRDSVSIVKKKNEWMILGLSGAITFSVKTGGLERLGKSWFSYTNDKGVFVVCDKKGIAAYTGSPKEDVEVISDRYLVIMENETGSIFDLKQKKYIFQN